MLKESIFRKFLQERIRGTPIDGEIFVIAGMHEQFDEHLFHVLNRLSKHITNKRQTQIQMQSRITMTDSIPTAPLTTTTPPLPPAPEAKAALSAFASGARSSEGFDWEAQSVEPFDHLNALSVIGSVMHVAWPEE